ncbi:MAG: low specificity L-threonine aldolase [Opitutaceae bacterium]|nr:low specificity L-threonine aldolase [Opitutaceae bacterium]
MATPTSPARTERYEFASDNTAGICPDAWAALAKANEGYIASYGEDDWTRRAADLIRGVFETDCDVFFVFNGTSANSLSLASLCQSYHSVLCHELAHVERDECGAPEFFSNGTKLITLAGEAGKLHPHDVERAIRARTDLHFPKPRVLTLTQSTECGTVYTPAEVRALAEVSKPKGVALHMDGARFANAAASLQERFGASPADVTWRAGVDVLSLGGTKNGMSGTEAVVFFNRGLSQDFEYRCKQAGQLCSKMRFLSAQWVGMLEQGRWLAHARHANAMAQRLAAGIAAVPGCGLAYPVDANAVFATLPRPAAEALLAHGWHFYDFIGNAGYRLMCSWATTEAVVDEFVDALRRTARGVDVV